MAMSVKKRVELEVYAPGVKGAGLNDLIRQLEKVKTLVGEIKASSVGLGNAGYSLGTISARVKDQQRRGPLTSDSLSKEFGIDRRTIDEATRNLSRMKDFVAEFKKTKRSLYQEMSGGGIEFVNPKFASKVLGNVFQTQAAIGQRLTNTLLGRGGPATMPTAMTAQQMQQFAQMFASALGGGPGAGNVARGASGQFVGASGSGITQSSQRTQRAQRGQIVSGGRLLSLPAGEAELKRVITETEGGARATITSAAGIGRTVATTFDDLGNVVRKSTTISNKEALLRELKVRRATILSGLTAKAKGLPAADLAALQEETAQQMGGLLSPAMLNGLEAKDVGAMAAAIQQRQAALTGSAAANRRSVRDADVESRVAREKALQRAQEKAERDREKSERAEEKRTLNLRRDQQKVKEQAKSDRDGEIEARVAGEEATDNEMRKMKRDYAKRSGAFNREQDKYKSNVRAAQDDQLRAAAPKHLRGAPMDDLRAYAMGAKPIPPAPDHLNPQNPTLRSTLAGIGSRFSPLTFLSNAGKVAGWSSAVGALYGGMQLAGSAVGSALEGGSETARLGQVFRGVGGDAKQLTDDILKLAAAEGRSREEAQASAIAWSRLGLTRSQVNQAVKVSLQAANVAEVDAGQATEYLQGLMQSYGLTVNQLGTTLGMVNAISNTFNATNKDVLEGISRVGNVARQAGMPLPQLMGMIGAGVGTTKQSGAQIGNALKSTLVSFNTPDVQDYLRYQHGISVFATGDQMKPGGEILGEIWAKYIGMPDRARRELVTRIAGKTQANRLSALLDSFAQGQALSVYAQNNTGSAEAEDSKIRETVAGRLEGLKTNFSRLFVNNGPLEGTLKGLIYAGNTSVDQFHDVAGGVNGLLSMLSSFGNGRGVRAGWRAELLRRGVNRDTELTQNHSGYLNQLVESGGSAMGSTAQLINYLGVIGQGYGGASSAERQKILASLGGISSLSPGFTTALQRAGGTGETEAVVEAEIAKQKVELGKRRELVARRKARRLRFLDSTIAGMQGKPEYASLVEELKAQRAAAESSGNGMLAEIDEAMGSEIPRVTIGTRGRMASREYVSGSYGRIYGESGTASGRLSLEGRTAAGRVSYLQSELNRAANDGSLSDAERKQETEALRKQLEEAQGQQASLTGAAYGAARREDRGNFARVFVGAELEGGTYGDTEMQRLDRRLKLTDELIIKRRELLTMADDQETKETAELQLLELQEDRVRTLVEMERARGRARQELFEEQRQLMVSSPQDLLRRSEAHRLLSQPGGLSGGNFMALSPEMRAAVLAEQRMMEHQRLAGDTTTRASGERLRDLMNQIHDSHPYNNPGGGDMIPSGTAEIGAAYGTRGPFVAAGVDVGDSARVAASNLVTMAGATTYAQNALMNFAGVAAAATEMIARILDPGLAGGQEGPVRAPGAPFVGQLHGD